MSDVDTDGCQYKIIAFLLQHAFHFFFLQHVHYIMMPFTSVYVYLKKFKAYLERYFGVYSKYMI